jgi:RHS repeat-associated protein
VSTYSDRGFTMHEHLDEMGVIHMNGRIYDPLIGRFMSADPTIPNPFNLKSFNRYSYVWNNPLKLYDPTGFEESGGGDGGSDGGGSEGGEGGESGQGSNSDGSCTSNCGGTTGGGQQAAPANAPAEAGGNDNPPCQGASCGNLTTQIGPGVQVAGLGISLGIAIVSIPAVVAVVTTPAQRQEMADSAARLVDAGTNLVREGIAKVKETFSNVLSMGQEGKETGKTEETKVGEETKTDGENKDGEKKPTLVPNKKHHPNSESPEPKNVQELFDKSVPDEFNKRWAKDDKGELHRFSKPSNNETHWNGTTDPKNPDPIQQQNIPNPIKKYWGY